MNFQPGQRVMICSEHDAMHATVIDCSDQLIIKFDELPDTTILEPWQVEQLLPLEEEAGYLE